MKYLSVRAICWFGFDIANMFLDRLDQADLVIVGNWCAHDLHKLVIANGPVWVNIGLPKQLVNYKRKHKNKSRWLHQY